MSSFAATGEIAGIWGPIGSGIGKRSWVFVDRGNGLTDADRMVNSPKNGKSAADFNADAKD
jgi:hypothetical protein